MGYLMLILSPTRHNPKSVDLALSLVRNTKRILLAVFIIDTKVTDAISGRIVDIGFLGDRVSTQLRNAVLSEYESRGHRELQEVRERAAEQGVECETVIGKGDFVTESLRIARERKVEDIVVSRAERSNLSRKLFGSAVNELLEKSPCPVMVVSDSSVENHGEANAQPSR
jgi:nucleotide-binding universal stress UspA family protein